MLSFILIYVAFDIVVMVCTIVYSILYCKLNKIPEIEVDHIFDELNGWLAISLSEIYSSLNVFCRYVFYIMNLVLMPIITTYIYGKAIKKMDDYVAIRKAES